MFMLSTLFMAMTCDDSTTYYTDVTFVNKSEDTLFVACGCTNDYDDVSPEVILVTQRRESLHRLLPNEELVEKMPILTEKDSEALMNIFLIFKNSTMKKYSDEELAEKNIYDKKLFFTYKELENKKFLVEYDGK